MTQPNVLIFSGYGLNCEEETLFTFERAGARGRIVHINDIIENPAILDEFQIAAIPGGFSYGDDTGSGNAFAGRIRNNLWDEMLAFAQRNTLMIGICNGCQILVNLGLVPGIGGAYGERSIGVLHNSTNRYQCRWVDVKTVSGKSPWLAGISQMHIPVAHGEGNFYMDAATLEKLGNNGQIALQYIKPEGGLANGEFPYNPNGSVLDTAAVTDESGRILAMMPHPERAIFFTQRDDWPLEKEKLLRQGKEIPDESDGMAVFRNAIKYFS